VPHLDITQHGIHWMLAGLEQWIMERCPLMGYQWPCMPTARSRSPIWSSLVACSHPGSRLKSTLNCLSLLTKSSSPHNRLLPRQLVLSYQWTRPSTIQVCQHCMPSPINLISALADHLPPGLRYHNCGHQEPCHAALQQRQLVHPCSVATATSR